MQTNKSFTFVDMLPRHNWSYIPVRLYHMYLPIVRTIMFQEIDGGKEHIVVNLFRSTSNRCSADRFMKSSVLRSPHGSVSIWTVNNTCLQISLGNFEFHKSVLQRTRPTVYWQQKKRITFPSILMWRTTLFQWQNQNGPRAYASSHRSCTYVSVNDNNGLFEHFRGSEITFVNKASLFIAVVYDDNFISQHHKIVIWRRDRPASFTPRRVVPLEWSSVL